MKTTLAASLVLGLAISSFADIQDPPSNDFGPTRKLGRGLANLLFGISELPNTIAKTNEREGNSSAAGYGVVRGLGRTCTRVEFGLLEFLTFPFPIANHTYYPLLPDEVPFTHAGYQEFPPELGNESKYPYVRMY